MLPGEDVRVAGAVVLLYSEGRVSANVRTGGRKPDFMRFRKNKKKDLHRKKLERTSILNKAEVVELVDTLGSGSSAGNGMGVRVSPSAPTRKKSPQSVKFCGLLFLCFPALKGLVVVVFVSHNFCWLFRYFSVRQDFS